MNKYENGGQVSETRFGMEIWYYDDGYLLDGTTVVTKRGNLFTDNLLFSFYTEEPPFCSDEA